MLFRQSGQSADRRRRVLTDGVLGSAAVTQRSASKSRQRDDQETYTDAAKPENQPAITEFMPTRRLTLALLFLLAIGAVAGLLALQNGIPALAIAAPIQITTLDALPHQSMAGWLSSMALAMAGLSAWVIYLVRRHRLDDYRGRYRVWLWTGLFWMFLSADEIAGFHDSYVALASHFTGWRPAGDGATWWLGTWGVLLGGFVLRLMFEIRRCRAAMASLLLMATLWSLAAALRLGWTPTIAVSLPLAASGAKLLGLVFLLLSTALYARYVILDAQGLIPRRKPKEPKRDKAAAAKTDKKVAGTTQTRIDLAHETPAAGRPTTAAPPTTWQQRSNVAQSVSSTGSSESEETEADGSRRLSKAERKRLRREQRSRDSDWV